MRRNSHAQEHAAQDRQHRWEQAMATARLRWAEAQRIEALTTQLAGRETPANARSYADALDLVADDPQQDGAAVREWAAWIRAYADRVDPVSRPVGPPELSEPQPQDLKPLLGRWSPYGPTG